MKTCSTCNKKKRFSYFSKHRGMKDGYQNVCRKCSRYYRSSWYSRNKLAHNKTCAKQDRERKYKALKYYSFTSKPKCLCCGETTFEFLVVDHIEGNPKREHGSSFYRRLVRENFPDGYRTLCNNCNHARSMYGDCPHANPAYNKLPENSRQVRKLRVLKHYSKKLECACCRESNIVFLSIDHIHGGGGRHIKEVGDLYSWLVRNNFPKGFRVLCFNCNQTLGHYEECPHEKENLNAEYNT